jgi:hypothetical protein
MAVSRWLDVSAAPRDGSPVILWIDDDEAPPAFPVTAGLWEVDAVSGISYWRVLGPKDGASVFFDQQIRGWIPLPLPGK